MAAKWERELTCAICQNLFNNPKILPCLHSFCTGCLKVEWSGKLANLDPSKRHLECPLCRTKILLSTSRAVEELPSHLSAIRLVESLREQANSKKVTPMCQNCDEGENAVSMCSDCAIFLCDFCVKSHEIGKATKCHKIQSLNEMRKGDVDISSLLPEKFEMCPTHPTKPLELYCKCEEVLLCRDCIIKTHKDHDYVVISDVVDGERKILKEALPGIQQLVDEVENAVTKVNWRREDVESRKTENLHKLDDIFQSLHAALDERQRQIRAKLTDDSKEKDKVLQVQENDLCFLLSQLKSCHSFIEDKVERGVNQDVLAMKRSMLERRDKLKELKNKTKLYPVVESQHPLHLKQVGKVTKLISQLEVTTPLRDYTMIDEQNCQLVTDYGGKDFNVICSVAIGPNDEVFVADRDNDEVIIFDKDLKLIKTFGQGSGDSKLNDPAGIAVGHNVMAISEGCDGLVKKFSLQGDFLSKFGSRGSGDGQFNNPIGLCFNSKGLLYVVDCNNQRVQVFRENVFLFKFGSKGLNPGQFTSPNCIATDSSDQVYVTDDVVSISIAEYEHELEVDFKDYHGGITVFSEDGHFIRKINCYNPYAICIPPDDYVISEADDVLIVLSPTLDLIAKLGESGFDKGVFSGLNGIAINSSGTIFVTECLNKRLQIITTSD